MTNVILFINLLVALVSAAAGLVAIYRPAALGGPAEGGGGGQFYVLMYAARAIPFGILAGTLPFLFGGWPVAALLIVAALIQLADVGIAIARRIIGMAIGAGIATLVHLVCAFAVL